MLLEIKNLRAEGSCKELFLKLKNFKDITEASLLGIEQSDSLKLRAEGVNRTHVSRATVAHSTIELHPPFIFNFKFEGIKMLLEFEIELRLVELQTVPITPLIYHNDFRK